MVFESPPVSQTANHAISRKSYAKLPQIIDVPNLIEVQLGSFQWFQEEGIKQSLEEVSPIEDFIGKRLELNFIGYEFREPRHTEQECYQRDLTYSVPLYVKARLLVKGTGEINNRRRRGKGGMSTLWAGRGWRKCSKCKGTGKINTETKSS